ncbi:AraC family transcriptional regulator [Saccharibacillus sp. JS10]|uniref:helix-turn-helix domain-containing protein n=1 Tax=Saccharibacillus sp. JS10 TaxID=2950552 RepID=UPI00210A06AE|nr:helix-turn-helix domain-containing protein [Saccharibacillus sp. JS10]MCQ4085688.1 helix-turn-helix domain-containing protein [Saccharibacillus sp. JS10]
MNEIIRIDSISMLHELLGYEKPKHPLITCIELNKFKPDQTYNNIQFVNAFYTISLKKGTNFNMQYGRRSYDFNEGSMIFMAPEQRLVVDFDPHYEATEGWMLCFHPDLIRKSSLGSKMDEYSFFSYSLHEALHLSEKEKAVVTQIVQILTEEFNQNIDIYSLDLIISNLELLLNYAQRFYGRQFITRKTANHDVVDRFEKLVKDSFTVQRLQETGIPSVKELAKEMGYSTNYLSDLLKKETGKNTQEHIHYQITDLAKNLLSGTSEPISTIAYHLGFEYPANFSKFFKSRTGMSPNQFRKY